MLSDIVKDLLWVGSAPGTKKAETKETLIQFNDSTITTMDRLPVLETYGYLSDQKYYFYLYYT
jgi:hypothetical protein